jgi:hypothetical protein
MRAFQEAYPNPPSIRPRRVVGSGEVWVVEARSDYGGQPPEAEDRIGARWS